MVLVQGCNAAKVTRPEQEEQRGTCATCAAALHSHSHSPPPAQPPSLASLLNTLA